VISVGVDIAKDPRNTALCELRWTESEAIVERLELGVTDDRIIERTNASLVTALDAPFGWPTAMVQAVSRWVPGGEWSRPSDTAFRLRATDEVTRQIVRDTLSRRTSAAREPVNPLSVSSDKIAMAAWRVCGILGALGSNCTVVTAALGAELTGQRHVIEAYPAAALALWTIERADYKNTNAAGARRREAMLAAILLQMKRRVRWSGADEATCTATDHALDAFVCALVARAAALGNVHPVPAEHHGAARIEGWIALPLPDALASL
jgi:predicted nuclease with RNAse H fold